jgi:endonuclease-8
LIVFAPGLVLETHLRMSGSWQLYAPGERWRKPAHLARVVIGVENAVGVCFSAPIVRTYPASQDRLAHLGPDLTVDGADIAVAVERFALLDPDCEIGVALLDQRVACGVGNVFKSEVLFAATASSNVAG